MRPLRQAGLLVTLATVAACAQCGGAVGPPPERHVPADVVAALIVPELRGAARSLAEFYATAQDFPGTAGLPGLRASLSSQLGFDPLDTAALRDAGLDPRGGLAIAWQGPSPKEKGAPRRGPPLLVVPVSNRAAAEAFVQRLATERLGAAQRSVEARGPSQVTVYRTGATAPPALSVAAADGSYLLCPGPEGPEAVARAVALAPGASLADTAAWQVARRAAGSDAAVIGFVPPGSPLLSGLWAVRDGAALALWAEPRKLHARLVTLLGDREAGFQALAATGDGGGLTSRLDPSAALVGRWDGAPGPLAAKLLPLIPERERDRLARAGIELGRDLFDALAAGGAASLSLAPRLELPTLDAKALRRDPLRLVQFELVLPLADAPRVAGLSERIARMGGQRRQGAPWTVPTASGEVAWAIDGDRLLVTGGGVGRLAALRGRMAGSAGGYRAPTDDARRTLASGGLGALVLDTRNAAASVRALPPEAFGTGPTGFVMRSLVERFVEPAERIEAASLRAALEPGALVLALEVQPAPPEERQP